MEAAEPDPDPSASFLVARAVRGLALITASVVAIAAVGVLYLHPVLVLPGRGTSPAPRATYRVSSLDFVDPSTGWVVVDFDSGNYAILHTDDGGLTWTRQLAGAARGRTHYLKFFDTAMGVFGQVGGAPELLKTSDGGRSWTSLSMPGVHGTVLSWSWVDSYFGWVLVAGTEATAPLPAYLYRTDDGGLDWLDLGVPVQPPDQVFQVDFTYFTTGWLTSANAGPYVYKSGDYGATWTRVPLPAPAGGWPAGGTFMVAVQPTSGEGVAASLVFVPTLQGRKGQGATIRDFPPLTVRAFDGGRPVTYVYAVGIVDKSLGPVPQAAAPNQSQFATLDDGATWQAIQVPSSPGAFGYSDAATWLWVGDGKWSTSRDGGASWTAPAAAEVEEPLPGSLMVIDGTHAWLAGATGASLETTSDGGRHWRLVMLPAVVDSSGAG